MKIPPKSALLLVDVQISKSNSPISDAIEDADRRESYYKSMDKLVKFFREKKDFPIVHIIELHRDDKSDFGRELDGSEHVHCLESDADFWPGAAPIEGEYNIPKRRYSAFLATDLDLLLRCKDIEHLFICGEMTDVCVHFTTVDAHQRNYHVHVMKDACFTPNSIEAHNAALENIEYLQTGSIITVDDLEW